MAAKGKGLADIALLLPKKGPKGPPPPGDGGDAPMPTGDSGGDLENAMSDFLQAIQAEDPKAMADSFAAAMNMAQE